MLDVPTDNISPQENILQYSPLVTSIADRISRSFRPRDHYDDAVQSGYVGLLEAAGNYDPQRGLSFKSYACIRIRGSIVDYYRSLDFVGSDIRRYGRNIQSVQARFLTLYGKEASNEDIASILMLSVEHLRKIMEALEARNLTSIDEVAENNLSPIHDINVLDSVDSGEATIKIKTFLESLPERDREMVRLYYSEDMTLFEIGDKLHLTEGRICQIHKKVIDGLRGDLLGESA